MQQPKQQTGAAKAPSRMTLASVTRGKKAKPARILLYGVEGIGKSTFAANAPKPIFLGAEDGTDHLDVPRFPTPTCWTEVLDILRTLTNEVHDYQTLVVDTLDWLEPLLWESICIRDNQQSIESYGYGKGYVAALDEWRVFLGAAERLRAAKGMHLIFLAHSWIKPFKNPEGDDFDRYELKLNPKAGGLLKEWADAVLFANFQTFAEKDSRTKRVKGVSNGARLLYTTRTAAYDAKNRYDLAEELQLDWDEFYEAMQAHRPADPVALLEALKENVQKLTDADLKKALAAMERAGNDPVKLSQLNTWINGKLAQREQEAA